MAEAKEHFGEKQHLECPVCFQPYNTLMYKPKTLPCGHSFCLECLEKITGPMNSIKCPNDRKQFSIPSGSVENFPNNFTVLEILTNLCDDCGGQPKQQVCLEEHCSMSLCDGCKENHCQSFHSDLRAALTELKQEATQYDDDSDIAQLEDNAEAAIAEVTKLCDELRQNLIKEIRMSKETAIDSYFEWNAAASITATECKVKAKKLLTQVGTIYKAHTRDEVLTDAHRQIIEMKTILATEENSKPDFVEFKTKTLKNEFDSFLLKLHLINPLTEITSDNLMMQDHASGGQSRSSTLQRHASTKPDYTRAILHTIYGQQGSGEGEFCTPSVISGSTVTNQVAVVDQNNHRIHLLTESLRPVCVLGEKGKGNNQYKYPWGVTITDRGVMFITDKDLHRVQATDSNGVFLYMFVSKGTGRDQFHYPKGIASTHEHLYICDSNNYRVKVTLHDGTNVRQFTTKYREVGTPWFIAACEAQDKAVISGINGNIIIFTLKGHLIRMIKSNQPPLNIIARGLAFDKHSNLIVADHNGNQLVVLGEQDQRLATIGSGQLTRCWGVALTLSGDIVVCVMGEHCVKLFKVPVDNKT